MPELAYVNGSFCPLGQARVSIEDRGFQFADGVYEVLVAYGRKPFMLQEHLERLRRSCEAIELPVCLEQLHLVAILREGIRRAGFDQTLLYIHLTRGVAPRQHEYPADVSPTVVMTFRPKPVVPERIREQGIAVATCADSRWTKCHIKTTALVANVLAKNEALARGYYDALFVGPDGDVREATSSNVFAIKSGGLITPPQDGKILHGITRVWVLRCARQLQLPVSEERLSVGDLASVEEVFLSSTTIEVLPVVRVDDRVIGGGRPGPWAAALYGRMLADLEALASPQHGQFAQDLQT